MASYHWLQPVVMRALLAWEWWQSGVVYNPLATHMYDNPYPTYAKLRSRDPIHWSALSHSWVFSRYRDVVDTLRDHTRFSSAGSQRDNPPPDQTAADNPRGASMLFLDPPDHTRLRALVQKAFTPRAIEALAPRIRQIVAELLDQIDDPSAFDVVTALAIPLPVIVMAELLGIPPADRRQFGHWSRQRARVLEPTISAQERRAAVEAAHHLDAYFLGIINQRRAEPRDDLVSGLVAAEAAGDQFTQDELLVMLRLLAVAGNETTTNFIGTGLLTLLRCPDQLQLLRQNAGWMASAVEELLRYDAPVQVDGRTALEELEIDGRHIQKGQSILLLLAAANRDPEVFHSPAKLDITRQEASHIAFGRGIHHCLGAPLARLEAHIAFETLLERFTEIRLRSDSPPFKRNVVLRGLKALPIAATMSRTPGIARRVTLTGV